VRLGVSPHVPLLPQSGPLPSGRRVRQISRLGSVPRDNAPTLPGLAGRDVVGPRGCPRARSWRQLRASVRDQRSRAHAGERGRRGTGLSPSLGLAERTEGSHSACGVTHQPGFTSLGV